MADSKIERLDTTQSDDERLAQIGHVQELRRGFSLWSLGSLCLCLMATWEALSTVIATALSSGGAPCLFFNFLLSIICTVAIALSLGEIASIYPTAGGQYHWVAALSPPSTRSVAAWFSGWINIGGQIVLTASAAFAAGLQIQALIILNDDSYIPQRWQGLLLYWAVLLYAAALNIWGARLLPTTNLLAGVLHLTGLVVIMVVLGVMAPKNNASFVFTEITNRSGWSNDGVSWLVGLLSAVYPVLGYDAACHLAEELPHAARNVPLAMIGSVVVNGVLGLGYCVLLLFSAGPLETLLATPTGFPFMQIFLDATRSHAAATVFTIVIDIIAIAAAVAGITSTSRTFWAFARDKATPFHHFFSHVNRSSQIPVRAVVLVTALQMALGFIYLGNSTAFNAVLSMAILGLYTSYLIPIVYWLVFGRPRFQSHQFGPFRMWKPLGVAVNLLACAWLVLAIVYGTFPGMMPVTAETMNYSIVVIAGWALFGAVYYLVWGRKQFEVPNVGHDARGF
ncbi:amino acid transporter [Aaosphaeria arxii CBS 175.79]|uniref:Amino acid transporter n=1 Tax=Aaosphaeria arxii CBS 175.79 TaxID=1450172 RepID=A0A6A5XES9_9PLEO|nr:amino acid transporter [Aaosphaeria arxii CBS 175.79]KAF2011608.1 amino acid transporter [Aaosphaeria arxii CBS 175.79]